MFLNCFSSFLFLLSFLRLDQSAAKSQRWKLNWYICCVNCFRFFMNFSVVTVSLRNFLLVSWWNDCYCPDRFMCLLGLCLPSSFFDGHFSSSINSPDCFWSCIVMVPVHISGTACCCWYLMLASEIREYVFHVVICVDEFMCHCFFRYPEFYCNDIISSAIITLWFWLTWIESLL